MIIRVIAAGILMAGKRAFLQLLLLRSSVSLWQAMLRALMETAVVKPEFCHH